MRTGTASKASATRAHSGFSTCFAMPSSVRRLLLRQQSLTARRWPDGYDWALRRFPHLSLYRLPPYSPQLQPIERLWRPLRQRGTHNLLFDEMTELQQALRSGLGYFRTRPHVILKLFGSLWTTTGLSEA
ncbi:hypothetical protein [Corallococcus llansteffanensis]|uniref:hypothetical protein n=1 Tax=Corallococcus llansteffanensis TaxID=2316731 RepID=UPI001ABF1CCE|nr:hypothetical protein [Corallococcus llansteffanensis]